MEAVKIKIIHKSTGGHEGEINSIIPEEVFTEIVKLLCDYKERFVNTYKDVNDFKEKSKQLSASTGNGL